MFNCFLSLFTIIVCDCFLSFASSQRMTMIIITLKSRSIKMYRVFFFSLSQWSYPVNSPETKKQPDVMYATGVRTLEDHTTAETLCLGKSA